MTTELEIELNVPTMKPSKLLFKSHFVFNLFAILYYYRHDTCIFLKGSIMIVRVYSHVQFLQIFPAGQLPIQQIRWPFGPTHDGIPTTGTTSKL